LTFWPDINWCARYRDGLSWPSTYSQLTYGKR